MYMDPILEKETSVNTINVLIHWIWHALLRLDDATVDEKQIYRARSFFY